MNQTMTSFGHGTFNLVKQDGVNGGEMLVMLVIWNIVHVVLKQFPGSSKENNPFHPNINWMDKTCNNAEPMLMYIENKVGF